MFEKAFVSTIIYYTQNANEVSYQAYWRKYQGQTLSMIDSE